MSFDSNQQIGKNGKVPIWIVLDSSSQNQSKQNNKIIPNEFIRSIESNYSSQKLDDSIKNDSNTREIQLYRKKDHQKEIQQVQNQISNKKLPRQNLSSEEKLIDHQKKIQKKRGRINRSVVLTKKSERKILKIMKASQNRKKTFLQTIAMYLQNQRQNQSQSNFLMNYWQFPRKPAQYQHQSQKTNEILLAKQNKIKSKLKKKFTLKNVYSNEIKEVHHKNDPYVDIQQDYPFLQGKKIEKSAQNQFMNRLSFIKSMRQLQKI